MIGNCISEDRTTLKHGVVMMLDRPHFDESRVESSSTASVMMRRLPSLQKRVNQNGGRRRSVSTMTRFEEGSRCLSYQWVCAAKCHGDWCLTMALRMHSSLRMHATRATLWSLPAV